MHESDRVRALAGIAAHRRPSRAGVARSSRAARSSRLATRARCRAAAASRHAGRTRQSFRPSPRLRTCRPSRRPASSHRRALSPRSRRWKRVRLRCTPQQRAGPCRSSRERRPWPEVYSNSRFEAALCDAGARGSFGKSCASKRSRQAQKGAVAAHAELGLILIQTGIVAPDPRERVERGSPSRRRHRGSWLRRGYRRSSPGGESCGRRSRRRRARSRSSRLWRRRSRCRR